MTIFTVSLGDPTDPASGAVPRDLDGAWQWTPDDDDAPAGVETKARVRRVRTPEGARFFNAPIGTPIVRDPVTGVMRAVTAAGPAKPRPTTRRARDVAPGTRVRAGGQTGVVQTVDVDPDSGDVLLQLDDGEPAVVLFPTDDVTVLAPPDADEPLPPSGATLTLNAPPTITGFPGDHGAMFKNAEELQVGDWLYVPDGYEDATGETVWAPRLVEHVWSDHLSDKLLIGLAGESIPRKLGPTESVPVGVAVNGPPGPGDPDDLDALDELLDLEGQEVPGQLPTKTASDVVVGDRIRVHEGWEDGLPAWRAATVLSVATDEDGAIRVDVGRTYPYVFAPHAGVPMAGPNDPPLEGVDLGLAGDLIGLEEEELAPPPPPEVPEAAPPPPETPKTTGQYAGFGQGATAEAKKQVKSVQERVDAGEDPEAALTAYRKDVNRVRNRIILDRKKAAEAAGQAVKQDQTKDAPEPADPSDPPEVVADKALSAIKGDKPVAIYGFSGAGHPGPGAVRPSSGGWQRVARTLDEGAVVPAIDVPIEAGYRASGVVVKRDGIAYLIESESPGVLTDAEKARLDAAIKNVGRVLAPLDAERKAHLAGVALVTGKNPSDAHWAKEYGVANFQSAATGGRGSITIWAGGTPLPGVLAHEYGHNVDTGIGGGTESTWFSKAEQPTLEGSGLAWPTVMDRDVWTSAAFGPSGGNSNGLWPIDFHETRPDTHLLTPGGGGVTAYGANSRAEDFAESVRLYLKDRNDGKLGYAAPRDWMPGHAEGDAWGPVVRFADLYPERAQLLDKVLGLETDFDTPWRKVAAGALKARVLQRLQTSGELPDDALYTSWQRDLGIGRLGPGVNVLDEALDEFNEGAKAALKDELGELYAAAGWVSDDVDADEWAALNEKYDTLSAGEKNAIVMQIEELAKAKLQLIMQDQAEAAAKAAAAKDTFDLAAGEKALKGAGETEWLRLARKRKASVKFHAKKKGATAEEAQLIADDYFRDQLWHRLTELKLLAGDLGAQDATAGGTEGSVKLEATTLEGFDLAAAEATLKDAGDDEWLKVASRRRKARAKSLLQAAGGAKPNKPARPKFSSTWQHSLEEINERVDAYLASGDQADLYALPYNRRTAAIKYRQRLKAWETWQAPPAEELEPLIANADAQAATVYRAQVWSRMIAQGHFTLDQLTGDKTHQTPTIPIHDSAAASAARTWYSQAGKTKHPLAAKFYNQAEQAKANIAAELGSRLNTPEGWQALRVHLAGSTADGGDNVRSVYSLTWLGSDGGYNAPTVSAKRADGTIKDFDELTADERQAILANHVSMVVARWAATSGDHNAISLASQVAVANEFGLSSDPWLRIKVEMSHGYSSNVDSTIAKSQEYYATAGPWLRSVMRTMYSHTQEEFAKEGVTHVAIYRGIRHNPLKDGSGAGTASVDHQPMESWSSSYGTAKSFSQGQYVMRATFPASRILGSCRTGFGCLNEQEFVPLDGPGAVDVKKGGWSGAA